MKFSLLVAACLVVSQFAHATPPQNACLTKIVALDRYLYLDATQKTCMLADDYVKLALSELCSDRKDDVSAHVSAYLGFEAQYKAAFTSYSQSAGTPAALVPDQQLRQTERDWMLFGFRDEVDSARGELALAEGHCLQDRR